MDDYFSFSSKFFSKKIVSESKIGTNVATGNEYNSGHFFHKNVTFANDFFAPKNVMFVRVKTEFARIALYSTIFTKIFAVSWCVRENYDIFLQGFGFNQVCGSGSVFGIRIRIQEGKNDPKKLKNFLKFHGGHSCTRRQGGRLQVEFGRLIIFVLPQNSLTKNFKWKKDWYKRLYRNINIIRDLFSQKSNIFRWFLCFEKCNVFFVYFFGGLECFDHSFAYVAHLWFLRDVWIRSQSAAVASWRATDLATHPSNLATHPSISHPSLWLATHPSD